MNFPLYIQFCVKVKNVNITEVCQLKISLQNALMFWSLPSPLLSAFVLEKYIVLVMF